LEERETSPLSKREKGHRFFSLFQGGENEKNNFFNSFDVYSGFFPNGRFSYSVFSPKYD
jgi:hypothetical protein